MNISNEKVDFNHIKKQKCAALACILLIIRKKKMNDKRKRSVWVKDWLKKRDVFSLETNLLRELAEGDEANYKNFVRMSLDDFNTLLQKVKPAI